VLGDTSSVLPTGHRSIYKLDDFVSACLSAAMSVWGSGRGGLPSPVCGLYIGQSTSKLFLL